jgi:di/tricarboxylate transporter
MITTAGWITTGILLGTLVAFAWGRLRPEVIVLAAVLAIGLSGVATPAEAFAGFGDPTVVTIAALFVLSAGLERTGVAYRIARSLLATVGASEARLIVAFMLLAAALSSFMNLFGAAAILLPIAVAACRQLGLNPSRLLLPLAISTRLGGALTLIGRPSNLVVSGFLANAGYAPLSFFTFLPVGIAFLAVGVVFMITYGRRLLPTRVPEGFTSSGLPRADLQETYRLPERLFRIRVDAGSHLAGKTLAETALSRSFGINVLGIVRGATGATIPAPSERLRAGDTLLVEARPDDMERVRQLASVEAEHDPAVDAALETEEIGLAEVILAPRSEMAGKSLKELEFRKRFELNVVALWRDGRPHRTWLADLPLEYGDALLVRGPRDRIRRLAADPNFISLDEPPAFRASRAPFAVLATAALILTGATGLVSISLAALLAAGIVVLTGCVRTEEVFGVVDWSTVVVVGGLLPFGVALHATGVAATLAGAVASLAGGVPIVALAAVLVTALAVGQAIPSVPATILMAPVALGAAQALGVNPMPFMITVASVTSITFAPISHPVNLMVMGPGGYHPRDYFRIGAPLAALLAAALLVVVTRVWKF